MIESVGVWLKGYLGLIYLYLSVDIPPVFGSRAGRGEGEWEGGGGVEKGRKTVRGETLKSSFRVSISKREKARYTILWRKYSSPGRREVKSWSPVFKAHVITATPHVKLNARLIGQLTLLPNISVRQY